MARRNWLLAMPPGRSICRSRIGDIAVVAVTILDAGSPAGTVSHSARFDHGADVEGWGTVTSSFPAQLVEIDDGSVVVGTARTVVLGTAWIRRGRGVPRRGGADRPGPCLTLQLRSQYRPGRRRIVDGATVRPPGFRGTGYLRHPPRASRQGDDFRRVASGRRRSGLRSWCFLVRHRASIRRVLLYRSPHLPVRRADVRFSC